MFTKIISGILAIWYFILSLFGINTNNDKPTVEENITVKNVIFMIGDGMGFNSIKKAVDELNLTDINLDRMELVAEAKTYCADRAVTDSAAGGTALACGIKADYHTVGVYTDDHDNTTSHPQNLCEMSISIGKSAGIVTTDNNYGATPAAFSTHTSDRSNYDDITQQQLDSDISLIWSYKSSKALSYDIEGSGWQLIQTAEDMATATSNKKSFGLFAHSIWHSYDYKNMPSLAEITTTAINILDDDEDGFFLMVEGAHIDKNSHNNNGDGMNDAFKAFDEAIGAAVDYAQTRTDTVVIVTADHETGGITYNNETEKYEYTSTGHSAANVPVYVYGTDDIGFESDVIENTDIPKAVAKLFSVSDFPKTVYNAAE